MTSTLRRIAVPQNLWNRMSLDEHVSTLSLNSLRRQIAASSRHIRDCPFSPEELPSSLPTLLESGKSRDNRSAIIDGIQTQLQSNLERSSSDRRRHSIRRSHTGFRRNRLQLYQGFAVCTNRSRTRARTVKLEGTPSNVVCSSVKPYALIYEWILYAAAILKGAKARSIGTRAPMRLVHLQNNCNQEEEPRFGA